LHGLAAALVAAVFLAGCTVESSAQRLEKARAALAARDMPTAEILLKNFLQKTPDDGEARMLLAKLHAVNRDWISAEKEWRRALEIGVAPEHAQPDLLAALVEQGNAKGALEAAGWYTVTAPQAKAAIAYWQGRAHRLSGKPELARVSFEAALAIMPELHRARVALLAQQAERGDRAGARSGVDTLLRQVPEQPDALLLKADLLLAQRDLPGARDALTRAIAADPTDPQARIRLVSLLTDLRDYPAAEVQQAGLAKLAPALPITRHLQAVLDFRLNRLDRAREGALDVLRLVPDYVPALALAANVALAQNELEQAEQFARTAFDRAPDSLQGSRLLASVLLRKNEPVRALQVAQTALARGVEDGALLAIAGEASLRRNEVDAAAGYFERAVKADPTDPAKRTGLGMARIAAGRAVAGHADLEAATKLDPQNTQADLALIMARLRARQFDAALTAVERLHDKQPGKALTHNLRGTVLLARGDAGKARTSFERALQLDPLFFAAIANLAELDMRDGNTQAARQRFEAALSRDPGNVPAMLALAQLAAKTGAAPVEVLDLLSRARAADPSNIEAVLATARHRIQGNQPREAIPMLQQALGLHPNHPALLEALGHAFLRADERQQAIDAFERLLLASPGSPAIHRRIAEIKTQFGDSEGARTSLSQAAQLERKPAAQRDAASYLANSQQTEGRRTSAAAVPQQSRPEPLRPAEPFKAAPTAAATTAAKAGAAEAASAEAIGDRLAAERNWTEAASAYAKALTVQRTASLAVKHHQALLRAGRAADAGAALRDALQRAPADSALRMYAAERAMIERDWKTAVTLYDAAAKANPGDVVALNNLAWSLKEIKDPRAAAVAREAYAKAPGTAQIADTLGVILLEGGEAQRGLEMIRKAIALAPQAPEYRLRHVRALVSTGDRAAAKTEIATLLRDFPQTAQAREAERLAATL
jgi:putative PEP-CTERM system TPR-repeat lipoprotein